MEEADICPIILSYNPMMYTYTHTHIFLFVRIMPYDSKGRSELNSLMVPEDN